MQQLPADEEKKEEEQKSQVQEPEPPVAPPKQEITLEVGSHKFTLNAKTAAGPKDLEVVVTCQEGGIISSDYSQNQGIQINGVVQAEKLTAKLQFQENPAREVQLDGDLKSASQIQGTYTLQSQAVPQVQGGGQLNIQLSAVQILLPTVDENAKPFISINTGGVAVRTQEGAGKEPTFNEALNLKIGNLDDDLSIEVFDQAAPDTALGSLKLKANDLCMNGGVQELSYTLVGSEQEEVCRLVVSTGYSAAEVVGPSSGWDQTGQFEMNKVQ
mmetsp:Transcript_40589/g.39164  ORF Transcript_40589/g.39164 Transcript_40589/m.39164 type:complete len:271 (-) Transcript_40589:50-862(-)